MDSFFKVKRPDEVFEIIDRYGPSGEESISLDNALGRVVSHDIISPENLPNFFRSSMDGYALRAKDTFGASESIPALVEVIGEQQMGCAPSMGISEGQAVMIPTGGMLPDGADGVVMVEYCNPLDEKTLEINRAISPLENVIQPGDDFQQGSIVVAKGHRLRPQDIGVIAGLGISDISVFTKPKVAIISTGDEILPLNKKPTPGQVRDINRYSLSSFCQWAGAEPIFTGLCPDDFGALKTMIEKALDQADTVWISGGSSVGTRDLTLNVFETLDDFELLVHGISISPGKPTIIGRSGRKPLLGLPGHVASALIVAQIFLSQLITRLSGQTDSEIGPAIRIKAKLGRNIESVSGREDYIRVKLIQEDASWIAKPIFGKSGLISTLVDADGLVRIDMNTEGLYQDQPVDVIPFNSMSGGLR